MSKTKLFKIINILVPSTLVGTLSLASLTAATGCSLIKKHETFNVTIYYEDMDVELSNHTAELNKDFETTVTSSKNITSVEIKVDSEVLSDEGYEFKKSNDDLFVYNLTIFGEYITSKNVYITFFSKEPEPVITNPVITFNAGEGYFTNPGETITTLEVEKGSTWLEVENKIPDPVHDTKSFDGWIVDGNKIDESYIFNEDVELTASYTDCEHEFDIWGVDSDNNRLYVECSKCGEWHYVNDEDLAKLEGCLLIKKADGTFEFIEGKTIAEAIVYARIPDEIHLYLIYGEYSLVGVSLSGDDVYDVHLHGLNDSQGKKISEVSCSSSPEWGPVSLTGVAIYGHNAIFNGATNNSLGFYLGIQSAAFICDHCEFIGLQSLYTTAAEFSNCTFDSSKFEPYWSDIEKIWRTEYSIYTYSCSHVDFINCNFISNGKAFKVYSEGAIGTVATLTSCHFSYRENPDVGASQIKACVSIDSTYQTADNHYKVTLTSCTQEGYGSGHKLVEETGVLQGDPRYPDISVVD